VVLRAVVLRAVVLRAAVLRHMSTSTTNNASTPSEI
jgi:hypothetical protein